jgi:ATP-dependent HslUV protease subunit HslV
VARHYHHRRAQEREDRDRRGWSGLHGQHGDEAERPQGPPHREEGKVVAGFAGATADAFTLFERLEKKLEQYSGQLLRAAVELTKDWRTDKYLRNLEALMIVADTDNLLVLTGNGDVLEPEAGSPPSVGRQLRARRGARHRRLEETPETIARKAMQVAADICVFTNGNVTVETV